MKKIVLMVALLLPAVVLLAQEQKDAPVKAKTEKSENTQINPSQLPKNVNNYITTNLPGAKITKATRNPGSQDAMYQVSVDLKGKEHSLIFDKDGNFRKMGEEKTKISTAPPKKK
jgi:hypothetical protein